MLAERMLARAGYRPVTYGEPAAALAALRAGQECAALLTDLQMPRVSGLELGRQAMELRPGLPVFLCSGNVDDALPRAQASEAGLRGVLHMERLVENLVPVLQHALVAT